ncbi:Holliday junction resolvase-like protein [Candidatus Altiarchaeota archaeon]
MTIAEGISGPDTLMMLAPFILCLCIGVWIGLKLGFHKGLAHFERKILPQRLRSQRSVVKGLVGENMSPLLPGFMHDPAECRFMGNPVDYIVFKGMAEGDIHEVVFLEVKTGKSRESRIQKSLKKAVESGKVSWNLYRHE